MALGKTTWEYAQQVSAECLQSEMGPGATDTTGIIPEIATMLSGLAEPPQLEPDQARFRLFDSVATFIKNSAASTPLAFVLDDLQWADCQGRREIVPAGRSKTMPLNAAV